MWNRLIAPAWFQKCLWLIVVVGLLASLPLAAQRVQTEQTANTVEIVFDYQDLVDIAHYKEHPQAFVEQELAKMKEIGITSLAVYESTLEQLERARRLQVMSAAEAMLLGVEDAHPAENYTYVLFSDPEEQEALRPLIEQGFAAFDAETSAWSTADHAGLVIDMALQQALITPLAPDPTTIRKLSASGFHVTVRLSDNRPFDPQQVEEMLADLSAEGVRWIIFAGDQVTGYEDDVERQTLTAMADRMQRHGIGLATIELLNVPQKGIGKLAYLTDYDTVRLHSIPEAETAMDHEQMADRLVLAAKDRNIRMLYLNAEARRDSARAQINDTLDNVYKALRGPDGAIARLQQEGFEIGQATPFLPEQAAWERVLKLVALLGAIALIALTIGAYVPQLLVPVTLLGYVGAAGLYVLSSSFLLQLAALAAAVSASTLAGIYAIRVCLRKQRMATQDRAGNSSVRRPLIGAVQIWLKAFLLALMGAVFVTGLLNSVTYMLVLEQFRGVTVLKVAPLALVAIYYFFFVDEDGIRGSLRKLNVFLRAHIKVGYVLLAGVLGVAGLYYLSRSGNQGQLLPFEKMVRAALEQALGARPRTQEFLIGHPLFLVGTWLALKYRKGLFILIFAVIGMLTMVGTFTHIHTPLLISVLRSFYGLLFGAGVGLVLIGLVQLAIRGWRKWKPAN